MELQYKQGYKEMEEYSLRSQVFQTIRENILKGKYKENSELREATLGKELGVSRTPVREALRQLELEGLVKIVPNKGAYVTGISNKDVHDIYVIRSLLEGLCVRWATENMSDKQIDDLDEIIVLSEFHMNKGNLEELNELDGQFHQVLYEASNSRILEHVLSDFHKYVQMARKNSVQTEDRAKKSIEEHKEIIAAIRERNLDKVQYLANEHIMHVMQNLHMK